MGSRTSGKREAPLVLLPAAPLPAPPCLNVDCRRIWRDVMKSVPTGCFVPSDVPLLTAFVVHLDLVQKMSKVIDEEGMFVKIGKADMLAMHPAVHMRKSAAGLLATLAVKLRISKSACMDPDAAATAMRNRPRGTTAKKPWEK